jgi:hypothetical protein
MPGVKGPKPSKEEEEIPNKHSKSNKNPKKTNKICLSDTEDSSVDEGRDLFTFSGSPK